MNTSRLSLAPLTLASAARGPRKSARPAFFAALFGASALSAVGLHLAREEVRRGAAEVRHALVAVRGDLALRARDVAVPEGALAGLACADARTRWSFPRATRETLEASLRDTLGDAGKAGVAVAQARCDDEGCTVEPDAAFVVSLPADARARLHAELGRDDPGAAHIAPLRRLGWDVAFAASPGLPAAAREAVARLAWEDQGVRVFADLPAACAHVRTDAERRALVRALHWPRTWEVALRTEPSSVARIVATFPRAAQAGLRDALAAAGAAGREAVPIDDFLPRAYRDRIGAWPTPEDTRARVLRLVLDVDGGPAAPRDPEEALALGYERVEDDRPRFGDVLVMRGGGYAVAGAGIHLAAGMVLLMPDVGAARPGRVAPLEEAVLGMTDLWRVETWRRRGAGQRGR